MLPHVLCNDLANEALRHLDKCYKEIYYNLADPGFLESLQALIKAVLHPQLSVLDLTWDWMFVTELVIDLVESLRNLKILKFKRNMLVSYEANLDKCTLSVTPDLHSLKCLQEMSVLFCCDDAILEMCSECCKSLKVLDVRGSQRVTDKSIAHILKLDMLEELKLSGTSISVNGYLRLQRSLVNEGRTKTLKSFDFDCFSSTQLSYVREFSSLKDISLVVRTYYALVSDYLDNVLMLKIKCGGFEVVKDILISKGKQLLKLVLDLDFNESVDLKFIAENCTSLQSLTVIADTCISELKDELMFDTITSLNLQTRNSAAVEYLVSRCRNLTSLTLCSGLEFYKHSLERIFLRNSMDALEDIAIGSNTDNLSAETLRFVTVHCKNLKSFEIFGSSYDETEKLCTLFPGVKISSKWQMPKLQVHFRKRYL